MEGVLRWSSIGQSLPRGEPRRDVSLDSPKRSNSLTRLFFRSHRYSDDGITRKIPTEQNSNTIESEIPIPRSESSTSAQDHRRRFSISPSKKL